MKYYWHNALTPSERAIGLTDNTNANYKGGESGLVSPSGTVSCRVEVGGSSAGASTVL